MTKDKDKELITSNYTKFPILDAIIQHTIKNEIYDIIEYNHCTGGIGEFKAAKYNLNKPNYNIIKFSNIKEFNTKKIRYCSN